MSIFTSPYVGTFGPGVLALPGPGVLRDPGLGIILSKAAAWYGTSAVYTGDEQSLPNRVNPAADPAQIGSTTGADTNDPLLLSHDGEDYVWFPGDAGNRVVVVGSLHTTTPAMFDMAVRVHIPAGGLPGELRLTGGSSTNKQLIITGGRIRIALRDSINGLWVGFVAADADIPVDDGVYWLRAALDTTTGETQYYWSDDGVSTYTEVTTWTLFSTVTGLAATAGWGIVNSSERLVGATSQTVGSSAPVIIYAAEWQMDSISVFSWLPGDGTVFRTALGLKTAVVTRPVAVFDGVDDYIQLPASDTPTFTATSGKHTVVVAFRTFDTSFAGERLLSGESAINDGLQIRLDSVNAYTFRVGGSVTSTRPAPPAASVGEREVLALIVDDGTLWGYQHGTGLTTEKDITGIGTITHSPPRVGIRGYTAVSAADLEVFEVLSFPDVALTEDELNKISAKLKAGS